MHILIQIVYWALIAVLGLAATGFILSFALALYSGLAVWIDYKFCLDEKNKAEQKETKKRGFFGVIKDTFVIVMWALWYAIIFSISAFMTILLLISEGVETLFRKLFKKSDNFDTFGY